ncbi:hypothetical protein HDV04_004681 [Boothiomyces sp. JEL0838]|nr:hypothetical protein HDV04_004681 [Boothiomyces sp. JEL0838]
MAPIYHLCSHIQNAYRNNLKKIAVPYNKTFKAITNILYEEGLVQSVSSGDVHGPFQVGYQVPITPSNIASRRIWIDLKYRHGEPALQKMGVVSKPSRRIFASVEECQAIAASKSSNSLLKNQSLGQITILNTPYGIIEMKEALKKQVGGEVLCYAT